MSAIIIDRDACLGCALCADACATNALKLEDGKATLDEEACVLCSFCVQACKVGAIKNPLGERRADCSDWEGVWVFSEQWDSEVAPVVLELLTCARSLADGLGQPLTAVLAGGDEQTCSLLTLYGANLVLHCGEESISQPDEERLTALLAQLVNTHKPAVLLFGATPLGRSLAPRLASRLGTGLTADCTQLHIDSETRLLYQTRPAFGGNLMASIICPDHRPQMATVRPGVFKASPAPVSSVVKTVKIPGATVSRITELSRTLVSSSESLSAADFIISVGKGIGSGKNLALVMRLADLLGAKVGCSRPLVESGQMSLEHQIGQSGNTVAPKMLIAFGISGAVQHLAGIRDAKCIIAVNSDPEAPIFDVAHYKVVGDCREVLEEMLAEAENRIG